MYLKTFFLFFFISTTLTAQNATSLNVSINQHIDGTLLMPTINTKNTLAIIIAGSGPTDRDGNQNFLQSNSLKKTSNRFN